MNFKGMNVQSIHMLVEGVVLAASAYYIHSRFEKQQMEIDLLKREIADLKRTLFAYLSNDDDIRSHIPINGSNGSNESDETDRRKSHIEDEDDESQYYPNNNDIIIEDSVNNRTIDGSGIVTVDDLFDDNDDSEYDNNEYDNNELEELESKPSPNDFSVVSNAVVSEDVVDSVVTDNKTADSVSVAKSQRDPKGNEVAYDKLSEPNLIDSLEALSEKPHSGIGSWTVNELKESLKEYGISTNGTKDKLYSKLKKYLILNEKQ